MGYLIVGQEFTAVGRELSTVGLGIFGKIHLWKSKMVWGPQGLAIPQGPRAISNEMTTSLGLIQHFQNRSN